MQGVAGGAADTSCGTPHASRPVGAAAPRHRQRLEGACGTDRPQLAVVLYCSARWRECPTMVRGWQQHTQRRLGPMPRRAGCWALHQLAAAAGKVPLPCAPHSFRVSASLRMTTHASPLVVTVCRKLAGSDRAVHFLDCGSHFLTPGGSAIDAGLMPDAVHPNAAGYELLAQCLHGTLSKLL